MRKLKNNTKKITFCKINLKKIKKYFFHIVKRNAYLKFQRKILKIEQLVDNPPNSALWGDQLIQ